MSSAVSDQDALHRKRVVFICFVAVLCYASWAFNTRAYENCEGDYPHREFRIPTFYYKQAQTKSFFQQGKRKLPETNSTLDFQKIFVINLPNRYDRKDTMTLLGSHTGFQFDFVDGFIYPEKQSRTAFPPHNVNQTSKSKLACYRAHANVWRKIVKERVATALILEDDVDWDVDVRQIAANMQEPFSFLRGTMREPIKDLNTDFIGRVQAWAFSIAQKSKSHPGWSNAQPDPSPWDIIRLGTCYDPPHTKSSKAFQVEIEEVPHVLYKDQHLPPVEWTSWDHRRTLEHYLGGDENSLNGIGRQRTFQADVDVEQSRRSSSRSYRLIQKSNYPVCLHAYAVTWRGAAKLLHQTGKNLIDGANDLTIARLTQRGQLKSFTVIPPLFGQWKTEGWIGNSDNQNITRIPFDTITSATRYQSRQKHLAALSYAWDIKTSLRRSLDFFYGSGLPREFVEGTEEGALGAFSKHKYVLP